MMQFLVTLYATYNLLDVGFFISAEKVRSMQQEHFTPPSVCIDLDPKSAWTHQLMKLTQVFLYQFPIIIIIIGCRAFVCIGLWDVRSRFCLQI